jgi:hypothetical protein
MIGSATSGVAVFAVGLTLAAHAVHLSKAVILGTLARITVQTSVLFALLHLLHVQGPFAREALVCCSFPLATAVVLFAAKYKAMEAESASMLLLSTLSLVVTVPVTLALSACSERILPLLWDYPWQSVETVSASLPERLSVSETGSACLCDRTVGTEVRLGIRHSVCGAVMRGEDFFGGARDGATASGLGEGRTLMFESPAVRQLAAMACSGCPTLVPVMQADKSQGSR